MKVRRRAKARSLFLGWSRVSVHSIRISSSSLVNGLRHMYRARTPDSTLLTFWPPAPLERKVSHLMAPSLISTSNSSASGSTATVAALVCTRPCVSVAGTRCTRCTPLSYFMIPYTPSPVTLKMISLYPPEEPSLKLDTAILQPLVSMYLLYMRNRSPAKRAASSPPVPPRISMMTFLSSSGSAGTRSSLISSSSSGMRFSLSASSSRSISLVSASSSIASISLASAMFWMQPTYSLRASTMRPRSLYSLVSLTYLFWSAITLGSVISVDTSSKRDTRPSSRSSKLFAISVFL